MVHEKGLVHVALAGILLVTAAHNQSTKIDCHKVRRVCGKRCEPRESYLFNTTIEQPRSCPQNFSSMSACETKACDQENALHICERRVTTKVTCESGCIEKLVLTRECRDDVECTNLANGGCRAKGEDVLFDTPEISCRNCKDGDVEDRMDNGTNPFATVVSERGYLILPFEDSKPSVRNVRCFAGFFEETECDGVSEVCRMGGRSFNSVLCSMKVCWQCRSIEKFGVSKALERYCRYLDREVCRRVVGGFGMSRMTKMNRMMGSVRAVENDDRGDGGGVCVDGCRRRVLGCGRRKKLCVGDEDVCEKTIVQRFLCPRKKQDERLHAGAFKVECGMETVPAVARITIGKCHRQYCTQRSCEKLV